MTDQLNEIEAQLDALLSELRKDADGPTDATSAPPPSAVPAAAVVETKPVAATQETDLADQIQQMLDEAKQQSEAAEPAAISQPAPPPAAPVASSSESAAEEAMAGEFETVEQVLGEDESPAPAVAEPVATADEPDTVSIEQIDQMLADNADAAVEQQEQPSVAPAPAPAIVAAAAVVAKPVDEPPSPPKAAADLSPGLAAVAEQLDADADSQSPPDARPAQLDAPEADSSSPPVLPVRLAHGLLVVINQPVLRASASTRQLLGLVAVAQLILGLGLLTYALFLKH